MARETIPVRPIATPTMIPILMFVGSELSKDEGGGVEVLELVLLVLVLEVCAAVGVCAGPVAAEVVSVVG